jgi:hypothetical protein
MNKLLTGNEPFCCLMFEICNNKKVSDSKMRNFFDEQGRTRISVEAYKYVRRRRKSEENTAHRKKNHL